VRVLGIDWGEKRIGLAVSDPMGWTAQPLETLPRTNKAAVMEAFRKTCDEWHVTEIVIGLPINMDGSQGPKAKEILELMPKLEAELKVPVKTWDERLTSKEATRFMIEGGLSRRRQKETSDRVAAVLILQNYLESIRK
jgi:putative holliday junction resolvase